MDKEIWKDVVGYEGIYQVSNLGNIKNVNYRGTGKERKLNGRINNGYVYVALTKNKKAKMFLLHRLVAQAFIPNLKNKDCINHLDCNRQNNRIDNLEWCTFQENIAYMDKLNRRKANKKLSIEEVKTIRNLKEKGCFYKDIWNKYKNKITFSGFQKVWYGQNWALKGDDTNE